MSMNMRRWLLNEYNFTHAKCRCVGMYGVSGSRKSNNIKGVRSDIIMISFGIPGTCLMVMSNRHNRSISVYYCFTTTLRGGGRCIVHSRNRARLLPPAEIYWRCPRTDSNRNIVSIDRINLMHRARLCLCSPTQTPFPLTL